MKWRRPSVLVTAAWSLLIFAAAAARADTVPAPIHVLDTGARGLIDTAQWCSDQVLSWKLRYSAQVFFLDVVTGERRTLTDAVFAPGVRYHCDAESLIATSPGQIAKFRLGDLGEMWRARFDPQIRVMRDGNALQRKNMGLPETPGQCELVVVDYYAEYPREMRNDPAVCIIKSHFDYYTGDWAPENMMYFQGAYYVVRNADGATALRLTSMDGPHLWMDLDFCPGDILCVAGDETLQLLELDGKGEIQDSLFRTTLSALVEPILAQYADSNYSMVEIAQLTPRGTVILFIRSTNAQLTCEVDPRDPKSTKCEVLKNPDIETWHTLAASRLRPTSGDATILAGNFGAEIGLFDYRLDGLCFLGSAGTAFCTPDRDMPGFPSTNSFGIGTFILTEDGPADADSTAGRRAVLRAAYSTSSVPPDGMDEPDPDRLYVVDTPVVLK